MALSMIFYSIYVNHPSTTVHTPTHNYYSLNNYNNNKKSLKESNITSITTTLYHAASDNTIPLMYRASENKELYTIHIIHHIQEKFFSQLNWN